MSILQKHNYNIKKNAAKGKYHLLNHFFQLGLKEYRLNRPFKEFPNTNNQFLYERGRQYAALIGTKTRSHNEHIKLFDQAISDESLI